LQSQWDWEVDVPELHTSVFIIPGGRVKNGDERLVVLNRTARSVIEARSRANLPLARVHDLKHTFGRRLRAAGVSLEDRQDLLGHRSARITTHYSAAELSRLIEAAEHVCEQNGRRPELVVLRGKLGANSRSRDD
jgi:integrase